MLRLAMGDRHSAAVAAKDGAIDESGSGSAAPEPPVPLPFDCFGRGSCQLSRWSA